MLSAHAGDPTGKTSSTHLSEVSWSLPEESELHINGMMIGNLSLYSLSLSLYIYIYVYEQWNIFYSSSYLVSLKIFLICWRFFAVTNLHSEAHFFFFLKNSCSCWTRRTLLSSIYQSLSQVNGNRVPILNYNLLFTRIRELVNYILYWAMLNFYSWHICHNIHCIVFNYIYSSI